MRYCNVDYIVYEHVIGIPDHMDKPHVEIHESCVEQNLTYEQAQKYIDWIMSIDPVDKYGRERRLYLWR